MIAEQMRRWLAEQGRAALHRLPKVERELSPLAANLLRLLQEQVGWHRVEPDHELGP